MHSRSKAGHEEGGLLPNEAQQFVEVVRCWCTIACGDAIGGIGCSQQTELLVVDEFPLLTLLDALNRQAQLLFQLVVGVVVEVAHAGMHTNNGLQRVQRVLRGILLVVDIGLGDDVVLLVTTHQVDVLLAVIVDRCLQAQLLIDGLVERLAEVGHLLDKLDQFLQLQAKEHGRSIPARPADQPRRNTRRRPRAQSASPRREAPC